MKIALYSLLLAFVTAFALPTEARQRDARGQKVTVYDASVVDVQPTFPGGDRAMLSFINTHRDRDIRVDEPQRVICGFVVMPDGQLTCISVLRGVDEAVNREAVRLIEKMPRWEAGRRHNRDVAVYCVVPIGFR